MPSRLDSDSRGRFRPQVEAVIELEFLPVRAHCVESREIPVASTSNCVQRESPVPQ